MSDDSHSGSPGPRIQRPRSYSLQVPELPRVCSKPRTLRFQRNGSLPSEDDASLSDWRIARSLDFDNTPSSPITLSSYYDSPSPKSEQKSPTSSMHRRISLAGRRRLSQTRHLSLQGFWDGQQSKINPTPLELDRHQPFGSSIKRAIMRRVLSLRMRSHKEVEEGIADEDDSTDSNDNLLVDNSHNVDQDQQDAEIGSTRLSRSTLQSGSLKARPKPLLRCNTEPENLTKHRRDALLPDWRHSSNASTQEGIKSFKNEFNPLIKRSTVKRKMKRSRLVRKDGDCNVYSTNVPKKEKQYLRDIFTTLIDAKWRWILLAFSAIFMTSWTAFSVVYFMLCFIHGDFDLTADLHAPNRTDACIENVDSALSAFLFSVETQHTIGYGHRYITTACPLAVVTICWQSLCGLLIQSFMVGLVFAKLARPKKRAETLIFSEKAVITLRDGKLCFCFRVADMRASHLVEAHLRMQMIMQRTSEEGEVEPLFQHDLELGYDSGVDRIFLVWPLTISHEIDVNSPLYDYSARQLPIAQFEIIVLLEGIVESTGMTAQARTSYLPSEVLWGHRFEKLVTYQKYNGSYQIDYSLFHNTYPVNTPRCSAKEWDAIKVRGLSQKKSESFFYKPLDEAEIEANVSTDEMTPCPSPRPQSSTTSIVIREEDDTYGADNDAQSIKTDSSSTLLAVKDGPWKPRFNSSMPNSSSPRPKFHLRRTEDSTRNRTPQIVVNSPPRTPSQISMTQCSSPIPVDPTKQITINCNNDMTISNF